MLGREECRHLADSVTNANSVCSHYMAQDYLVIYGGSIINCRENPGYRYRISNYLGKQTRRVHFPPNLDEADYSCECLWHTAEMY